MGGDVRKLVDVWESIYVEQVIVPGAARRYAPADGNSTRGGSTSVRGRVRSPHMAKLQAASVIIA